MMNKRPREDTSDDAASENQPAKKQRIRKRSNSEPLGTESVPVEKRYALRRMFGRICAIDLGQNLPPAVDPEKNQQPASEASVENQLPTSEPVENPLPTSDSKDPDEPEDAEDPEIEELSEVDENSLVDDVPADMDPEQLGFLVCAQETLRFLNGSGVSYQHPVFNHLRLRLLRGINEIGVA